VANTSVTAATATIAAIPTGRKDALALEDRFRYRLIVVTYRTGAPNQGGFTALFVNPPLVFPDFVRLR